MNGPKILVIDIETAPSIVYAWGLFDQNVGIDQVIQDGYVLSWAAKWVGQREIMFDSIKKHKLFKTEPTNDINVAVSAHNIMSEADIIVAHNGDNFDLKWLNLIFLKHKMVPVPPYKTVDTLKVARGNFYFLSNKLDFISKKLGVGQKVKHEGFPLWKKCMSGDRAAWKRMEKYNKQDVSILEKVYLRMRPYMKRHPNHGDYVDEDKMLCPTCGSDDLRRNGMRRVSSGSYARYQCNACGHWSRGRRVYKAN